MIKPVRENIANIFKRNIILINTIDSCYIIKKHIVLFYNIYSNVVVSLWNVASEPAVEYMKIFYDYLKTGKGRAESLELARKEIKTKYKKPFYWAVFVLYGEG